MFKKSALTVTFGKLKQIEATLVKILGKSLKIPVAVKLKRLAKVLQSEMNPLQELIDEKKNKFQLLKTAYEKVEPKDEDIENNFKEAYEKHLSEIKEILETEIVIKNYEPVSISILVEADIELSALELASIDDLFEEEDE